ncbi:HAD family hydrolase [Helicobacter cholecystus]|uniref:HAD family hydrolase n=1 Tax=Helicobacter cholecystus TaxID=45498 RepID=UPI0027398A47|nr:HAD family hydrolase [Helicobacter cholecystus]
MKGYILDLDNTLYDENGYLHYVFLEFWEKHNLDKNLFKSICSQALCDESRLNSKDIFKTFLNLTPIGYTKHAHDELFEIYTSLDCEINLYEDAKEFLEYLSTKNTPVAILTNGPIKAQSNKIRNLSLSLPVFYARENGIQYEKPHPNAFQKVLDFFSLPPQECCMIGDHPHTDLHGASQIGITPIWLQRGYTRNMDYTLKINKISNFNKLKEIL